MDLTQDVTYPSLNTFGTISLNDAAGVSTGSPVTGRSIDRVVWQPVPGVGYTEKRAQASGNDAADAFDGPRRLQLIGTQYGATPGALAAAIRQLRSAFSTEMAYNEDPDNSGYLALTFHERDTEGSGNFTNDDITMALYCRPVAGVSIDEDKNSAAAVVGKGGSVGWSVVLEAKDPVRYNVTAVTDSDATGTSGSLALTNRGDRPAPVTVTVTVASPGHVGTLRLQGPNSSDITIATEVAGTRTYTLYATGLKSHLLYVTEAAQETLRMDLLTQSAEFWPTVPANSESSMNWSTTGFSSGQITVAVSINEPFS